ncbi:MAG: winged helix-turn-helix domain-containing protein [Candidatus Bathyarchaeota archaeon]|nr:winged helix-turn-helix domain-containing protein [Candidatus Bathyarchaeota archaeon]
MGLTNDEVTGRLATIFQALGNETRLKALMLIKDTKRPLHIKAVSNALQIEYAALYRHVKMLQRSGLLETFEVGRSQVLALKQHEAVNQLLQIAQKISE